MPKHSIICNAEEVERKKLDKGVKIMEVLYRGKDIKTGKWVFGDLIQLITGKKYILPHFDGDWQDNQVIPSSVGLYTGLKDKNGKKIFGAVGEKGGDIVKLPEDWDEYGWNGGKVGDVVYSDFFFGISLPSDNKPGTRYIVFLEDSTKLEIIGNMTDTPQLVEGER